jgi:polyisoprenoid-binding protein YceI
MKKIMLTLIVAASLLTTSQAQNLFFTRNGHIDFYSSAPMENIKADNNKVTSIIDVTTGDIEFSVLSMAFQFEKALMQEHFNEKYMESSKYPKSTFKGKITNLDKVSFSNDGSYTADISGKITIHGVTKDISTNATIVVKDGKFSAQSSFIVRPEDFKIEIPNLVRDNIAKEIKVTIDNNYQPFTK